MSGRRSAGRWGAPSGEAAEAFKLIEQIKKIESAPPKGIEDNFERNRELFRLRKEIARLSRLAANLDAMRMKDYGGVR